MFPLNRLDSHPRTEVRRTEARQFRSHTPRAVCVSSHSLSHSRLHQLWALLARGEFLLWGDFCAALLVVGTGFHQSNTSSCHVYEGVPAAAQRHMHSCVWERKVKFAVATAFWSSIPSFENANLVYACRPHVNARFVKTLLCEISWRWPLTFL